MKFRSFLRKIYRINLEKVFTKIGIDKRLKTWSIKTRGEGPAQTTNLLPYKERNFDDPVRFIHIGYPKAGSTAIQKGFFGQHNQILHLGCGNGIKKNYWDDHGYISKEINLAVEIDLRFRNKLIYDEEKIKKIFDPFFNRAKVDKHYHAIGLSNENFCFNWHGGIDTVEKAKRLYGIFGSNTQIIIVLRNQKDLVESLYKESIRFGYKGLFRDYLKYIWQYKDRNFYYDFHFDKIFNLYSEIFGRENVHTFFFEEFRNEQNRFLEHITEILKLDFIISSISKSYNTQLSDKELYIKRIINEKFPHTFEKGIYHPIDTHRYTPYFQEELNQDVEFEDYLDYHFRNDLCQLSKKLASKVKVDPIELNWNCENGNKILKGFSESNQLFFSRSKLTQLKKYSYLNL